MDRHFGTGEESPPTLGVREPRKPKPPTLSPGYALEPPTHDDAATGENPRMTFAVSRGEAA